VQNTSLASHCLIGVFDLFESGSPLIAFNLTKRKRGTRNRRECKLFFG
jgi:hypothetical protein